MKTPITAALFSAAVFPGAGHFWLKKWLAGSIFAGATCYALFSLFAILFRISRAIGKQIQTGDIPLDFVKIYHAVHTELASGNSGSISGPLWLLLIIWVVGVADAYRAGHFHEKRLS